MGDDSEWQNLPPEDKVVHKVWKARVAGYEQAIKIFQMADSPKSPEFGKFLGAIKKMVTDSNAIAQEKALEAVLCFVENAHVAGKTAGEVVGCVVNKCLNASRAKTKERGIEILLMYVEIEKQEIVQEELFKGLANKQPKIVVACVQTLRQALCEFGPKVITIKPLVKQIQPLLEHRDKTVREEGKVLVVEIYRWIGAALKPQLASLKPVQITELEAEFENVAGAKAQQTRFLRSQQDLKAKFEEQAAAGDDAEDDDEDGGGAAMEIDPFELMEAVDILAKLPKDFYDKSEAKKWQERKEALEALLKLAESPKIENGDFNDVVRVLKRVIAKDSNVMLVTIAAKCVAGLGNGLRKKFSVHAPGCIDVIVEKFKEKKPTVVAALREAADACFLSTTLDPLSETCVAILAHKNPGIKAETASFLARCFTKCTTATLPKKMLKMFAAALLKTVNDTAPEVREASFMALGTAMKVVGEKHLGPFLADVEPIKMEKIKECCEKAEVVGKKAKPAGAAAPAPAKAAAKPASARPGAPPRKDTKESGAGSKPASAAAGRPKTAPVKGGAKKKPPPKGKGKGKAGASSEKVTENFIADEVVDEKAAELLPGDTLTRLASSNWKERLAAMETFNNTLKTMTKDEIPCQVCVRTITKKPGLKETNFQVMKHKVEMIAHLAKNAKFSERSASFVLSELVDKVGDVKNGAACKESLSCIAEATSLEHVSLEVVNAAFAQKNPKNQAESLNWLSQAVKEFGFKVNVKAMIETIKKALGATNPTVRTAAVSLMGVLYMYMGATLRVLFENEKAALLSQIDAEIEKVSGTKPPAPIRGSTKSDGAEADGGDEEEEEEGEEAINVADLVPRTDISEKITDALVEELADKNWKVRNEALQKVVAILNEAKFITADIGPLPESLKHRLGDSNKILMTTTLNICQTLSTAMGPNIKNHVRALGPGIAACCGDSKPQVRATAITTLSNWVDQGGFKIWIEAEIFSDELRKENPNLRSELLGWLASRLPEAKKLPLPELKLCVPPLLACLEDRNGGVRAKAQEALVPFMIHTGYESLVKAAGKLGPSSKVTVMTQLEKAKENLPAKPVKTKAAAAPVKAAAAAAAAPVSTYDEPEDEPERPATAPAKTAVVKGKSKVLGKKAAAPAPSKKKKEEDIDTSPAMRVATDSKATKEERFKDEKKLKVLKWNFTVPRQEFVDQIQAQMEPNFNRTLMDNIFHSDFKRHILAIETLAKACEEDIEPTIANLDLVFKWLTLRFFDTNTSVLLKALEYLLTLFTLLSETEYHLHELEANAFIPYLINKVGDPKENVRREIRAIFKKICSVYPASKMFSFVIDGIKSKNTKQKTECLEELGWLIETYGINVCQPSPAAAMKLIASQIGVRDNSVRSAALNTIVAAYSILGETVYKYVGNLNDKDQGMLEERIKRSAKSKPPPPPEKKVSPKDEKPRMVAKVPPTQKAASSEGGPRGGLQAPRQAKKTGRFQLDLDDDGEDLQVESPNLIQIDVDEILNEPVKLPVIKSRRRPPSPSMRLLHTSSDAKSAIDLVISQVAGNDIFTSMQALHQIDEVLKDEEKSQTLIAHVDQLLLVCALQLRMASTKYSNASSEDRETILSLLKCILGTLLSLFQSKVLSRCPSKDALKDLIYNLITVLLDSRINSLEDGPQVVRSVNVMVVKIVDKGDHTNVMRALIKLLHESVENPSNSQKFLELVMKCLWKCVRILPNIINDLDASLLIGDLHQFMKAFPGSEWKTRQNDTPLRTVKTILHSLAKLKGPKIINHLDQIDTRNSEVELYLRKVLKNSLDPNTNIDAFNNENEQMNGQNDQRRDSSKASKRLSKSSHDMLAEIFKKIGSKENTREGLNDLYDFKLTFPDADLEPFLKKSSQFFQNYIERGLKNIEMERQGKMKSSGSSVSSNPGEGAESGASSSNIAQHLKFIKECRAKCGFDDQDNNENTAADSVELEGAGPDSDSVRKHVEFLRNIRAQCGLDNRELDTKFQHLLDENGEKPLSASQRLNGSSSSLSSSSSAGTQSIPSGMTTSTSNPENLSGAANNTADVSDLRRRLERIKNATKK